jgi:predicted transcriptional regulator
MKRNLIYLDVETLLEDIFELVSANKSNLMLVTENGQHIGVLDTENLLEFLLIKGKIKTSLCLKFEKQLILTESN